LLDSIFKGPFRQKAGKCREDRGDKYQLLEATQQRHEEEVVVLSTKYLRPARSAMLELKRSFFFSLASRSNFFFVNLHKKFAGLKKFSFSHKNGNVWTIFAKILVKYRQCGRNWKKAFFNRNWDSRIILLWIKISFILRIHSIL
jgi:hypothetical protein